MSCDVGKATEGLENELWRRWNDEKVGEWALLINVTYWASLISFVFYIMGGSPGDVRKWRACDVGKAKKGLENELWRRWSNERVGEWAETYVKRRKGWRMSCDVGEETESLENELCLLLILPDERALHKHGRLAGWIKWRACDVGEAKQGLENELWRRWSNGSVGEWAVT